MQNPFQALFSKFVNSIHHFSFDCQQNVTFYMKTSKTPPQISLFSEIVPQPLLANKEKYLPLDTGVALSSLACFMSADLARDLTGDILSLLTSTKPYIRKKAVLILYKVRYLTKLFQN